MTTGLQTDSLIKAIMAQDALPVERLKDRQILNTKRSAALNSMRTSMTSLTVGMASLYDKLSSKAVSSTDPDGKFVTATASGGASGAFEVKVTSVATRGQLAPTLSGGAPTNMAVADPNAPILTSGSGSFAVKGTDGVVKAFQLTNNSLNGLRDAINASGAGVTASIVNTGSGSNPFQLVLTAKETGTGVTGGSVSLAAIENPDAIHPAFDHAQVATALGKALDRPMEAAKLPLSGVTLEALDRLGFTMEGQAWSCAPDGTRLEKKPAPGPALPAAKETLSPDGRFKALVEDHNVVVRSVKE
ncbi:MAG TPA: flagellar cap protein FliD N-terminal domain-containing protein, partial [Fibrobacteria bacterium]|nr:flagellar cap protein FliD N-terminal domain-containing protein [Fibrobacteria bacterium]